MYCEGKPGSFTVLSGNAAQRKIKAVFDRQKTSGVNEIKGLPASPGNVQGTAKVSHKAGDLIKSIKKGDILITSMTTPDFIPAMRKAAAIVTDEGGITCHSAIISRELGIPCVIGTKVTTQIFKTGDRVLVDATGGVVRRL
jgi:pyruvate,water dikinase